MAKISIRLFLIATMVALTLTSSVIIGTLIYSAGVRSVHKSTSALRAEVVAKKELEIKNFFRTPIAVLGALQVASKIRGTFNFSDPDTWDSWICSMLRESGGLPTYLGTEEGLVASAELLNRNQCNIFKVIRLGVAANTRMNYSSNGVPFYASALRLNVRNSTFNATSRPWYRASRVNTTWSAVYQNINSIETVITAGGPMFDPIAQRDVGVFAVDLRTTQLVSFLSEIRLGGHMSRLVLAERSSRHVIGTSWNEPAVLNVTVNGTSSFAMARLDNYTDPLLKKAIASLGVDTLYDCNDLVNNTDGVVKCDREFGSGRDRVYVDVVGIRDAYGLELRLIVLIPEAQFLDEMWRRSDAAIGIAAGVVSGLIILVTVAVYFALKELKQVEERLQRAARLQDIGSADATRSFFSEIASIQEAYTFMAGELQRLKCFVPLSIMEQDRDGGSVDSLGASQSQPSNPLIPVELTAVEEVQSSPTNPIFAIGAPGGDHSLGDAPSPSFSSNGSGGHLKRLVIATSTVASELNQFATKRCTAVGIEIPSLPTGDPKYLGRAVDKHMAAIVKRAVQLGGVLETMSPDFLLVTFNAHYSCVMHEERAVAFAMRTVSRLQNCAFVGIDTTDTAIGTCGVEDRKARVVLGECIDVVRKLTVLQRSYLGSRIVVTERCARGVGNRTFALIESISPCWYQADRARVLHLCVPEHPGETSRAIFTAEHRAAYSALMRGKVGEALRIWRQIVAAKPDVADPHIGRLIDTCAALPEELPAAFTRQEVLPIDLTGLSRHLIAIESVPENSTSTTQSPQAVAQQIEAAFVAPPVAADEDVLFPLFQPVDEPQPHNDAPPSLRKPIRDVRGTHWLLSHEPIAKGAFSEVHQGLSATGALAAVKVMRASSRTFDVAAILNEVQVLAGLRHEHIVPYVSVAVEGREAVYIIMELAAGGSLRDLIGRFGALDASIVRRFTVDTLKGLQYLHENGVTHCDLKSQNLLLSTEGVCKLADFGSALNGATAFEGSWDALRGTSWYAAPEVCAGERPTPASDVWSLAITLLEMATGTVPWSVEQRSGNREAVFLQRMVQWTKGGPAMVPAVPETLPADLRSTVTRCLQLDPAARPTCADLLASEFVI